MLKLIAGNAQHIGARREQQDSFAFSNMRDAAFAAHGGLLGVLADGMGGLEGGQQASSTAVEAFLAAYGRKTPREPVPVALHRSLAEANRAVLTVARRTGAEGNTGTTLAAVVAHNDLLYWIASGDSRVYLLRDGRLTRVNADHTYLNSLWPGIAAGSIDRMKALSDPQASHLTSHLGMEEPTLIDLSQRAFPLRSDDVVIACSDGIYRGISEEEMAEAFRGQSSSQGCQAIQANVLAKGRSSQDNLTIIALQCRDDRSPALMAGEAGSGVQRKQSHTLLLVAASLELLLAAGLGAYYIATRWANRAVQPAKVTVEQPALSPREHRDGVPAQTTPSPTQDGHLDQGRSPSSTDPQGGSGTPSNEGRDKNSNAGTGGGAAREMGHANAQSGAREAADQEGGAASVRPAPEQKKKSGTLPDHQASPDHSDPKQPLPGSQPVPSPPGGPSSAPNPTASPQTHSPGTASIPKEGTR